MKNNSDEKNQEFLLKEYKSFYNFLTEYNILKDFIYYYNKYSFNDLELDDYLENTKPKYFIKNAFPWIKTENIKDWSKINDDWEETIKTPTYF